LAGQDANFSPCRSVARKAPRFSAWKASRSRTQRALHKQSGLRNIHRRFGANVIVTTANSHARNSGEEP
jgi:hypothetical protein